MEKMKVEEYQAVPRNVYIAKEDLERWGYTVGCPGCKSILRGTTRQGHSEACRRRIENAIALDNPDRFNRALVQYMDKNPLEKESSSAWASLQSAKVAGFRRK